MRHVVEAGTDAAAVLLFDPAALPPDFDRRAAEDPADLLDELHQAGTVFSTDTGGDGRYLLHAYVDEPVSPHLEPFLRDPVVVESFPVPGGQLYFSGAEYGFREDASFLQRYPHMGGCFELPPGTYRLTLWRTEYPDNLAEQRLRQEVSPLAYQLHQGMGCCVGMAVLAFLGLVVAIFRAPAAPWRPGLFLALGTLAILPLALARSGAYRAARQRFREIERELPSFVAQLEYRG